MASDAELTFDVLDLAEQEIQVTAEGENVLRLEENADAFEGDPDSLRPDVVGVFCDCAELGMLCGARHPSARSGARTLAKDVDIEARVQSWRLALTGVDPGAFRVLLNVLWALRLERIELRTVGRPAGGSVAPVRIDPRGLDYPGRSEPLPFALDYEDPEGASGGPRVVRIGFARELGDEQVEAACAALRSWSLLMALGGYAPDDLDPFNSGAAPDVPFQYDAFTVELSFELFLCDESAFHAILNWAKRRHGPDFPIEKIEVVC